VFSFYGVEVGGTQGDKIYPKSSGASQEDFVSGRMQAVSGGAECVSTEVACNNQVENQVGVGEMLQTHLTEVPRNNQVENQVGICEVCLVLLTEVVC